ncbi:hypothetical protein [Caballeronia sp. M23-90]
MKSILPFTGIAIYVALSTPAAAASPGNGKCLQFDPAKSTIVGKATLGRYPNGGPFAAIVPDKPVCIAGGGTDYTDANGLTVLALYFNGKSVLPKQWQGKHVAVSGLLRQGVDPHEVATPNFMLVDSIKAAH